MFGGCVQRDVHVLAVHRIVCASEETTRNQLYLSQSIFVVLFAHLKGILADFSFVLSFSRSGCRPPVGAVLASRACFPCASMLLLLSGCSAVPFPRRCPFLLSSSPFPSHFLMAVAVFALSVFFFLLAMSAGARRLRQVRPAHGGRVASTLAALLLLRLLHLHRVEHPQRSAGAAARVADGVPPHPQCPRSSSGAALYCIGVRIGCCMYYC